MKRTVFVCGLFASSLMLAACTPQDGEGLPSQVIFTNVDIQILPVDKQGSSAIARAQVHMNNERSIKMNTLSVSIADNYQTHQQNQQYPWPEIPEDSPINTFDYYLFEGLYYTHFSLFGDYYNEQQTFKITTSNKVFAAIKSSITHQGAPFFTTDLSSQDFLPGDSLSINWQNNTNLNIDTFWLTGCGIREAQSIENLSPLEISLPESHLLKDLDMETGKELDHCILSVYLVGRKKVNVNERFAGGHINLQVFSLPTTTKILLD